MRFFADIRIYLCIAYDYNHGVDELGKSCHL